MTARDITWSQPPRGTRGPRRSLTLTQIARAAVTIADRDGLGAVTMASVATRMGCTKMALYRYVRIKDDLHALMFDHALGGPPAAAGGGWASGMGGWSHALMARYDRHPWAVDVPLSGGAMTRNRARWLEAALVVMRDAPLPGRAKLRAVLLLNGHIVFTAKLRRDAASVTSAPVDLASLAVDFPEMDRAIRAGDLGGKPSRGAASPHAFSWGVDAILAGVQATGGSW
jgi:AcrR family transcriptional regulator